MQPQESRLLSVSRSNLCISFTLHTPLSGVRYFSLWTGIRLKLNWNPKLIATLSCVCKWFDDLAKRVLWKAFCRARAPKMMLDLQSSGSHSVDGNWRALGKLLIYCSGCTKGGLFNNVHIPGHFVYRTRFSRTSGKSFLLPQCRTDVLYVSDPCEHLDQGDEGDVGFFRGIFKSFSMSKVRKMLIKRGAQLHPTEAWIVPCGLSKCGREGID
ncbi:EID1-like F-box protein 2 [Populus alba x Populus x berolinensis]|nr:EID1-like F-box protein 2 [Populus alba x Populus x berolinensis]